MQTRTLKIKDIEILNNIQKSLLKAEQLSKEQQQSLLELLSQIPRSNQLLAEKIPLEKSLRVNLLSIQEIDIIVKNWISLFNNIPGYDYAPCCLLVLGNEKLLRENVIVTASFAPSMAYNLLEDEEGFELYLKDNGTASFQLPSLEDAEQYPELYNFKGTWKEAYLLLIDTLKKGWPMDEFPEELLPLLKK
ncbi:MAG: hypothetical protein JWP94_2949 [Mucilaginibacter sp.]|nr:hypothetical protein [Mucilaginibacter sp.]